MSSAELYLGTAIRFFLDVKRTGGGSESRVARTRRAALGEIRPDMLGAYVVAGRRDAVARWLTCYG